MEEKEPRQVQVPFAGFVVVDIDPDIEVRTSIGWDAPTEFEEAAREAADELLGELSFPEGSCPDWQIEAFIALTRGNAVYPECNDVTDLGVG